MYTVTSKLTNCNNCGNETFNKKFCSRKCSTTFNNKSSPKRKLTRICHTCDTHVNYRNKYCTQCYNTHFKAKDMTLDEAKYKHHTSGAYSLIRSRAVSQTKPTGKACVNCGYDKHVEVCHIKAISTFDGTTLVSEINNPSNLIILCPNCHWEFDYGELNLVGVTGFEPVKSG